MNPPSFVYDADGNRVQSTITPQGQSGVTTTFVGNYYETDGSTVTKHYYAGAQRVAVRSGSTVSYLLSDQLGSTSITTESNGAKVSEMRYTAWGQVRYSDGTTPTDYTYTGQYSNTDDFGLMFYVARWYDPALGRFTSADSVAPEGVQGWDRYAYANNSPVVYNDPSGHCPWCVIVALVGLSISASQIPSDMYQSDPAQRGDAGVFMGGLAIAGGARAIVALASETAMGVAKLIDNPALLDVGIRGYNSATAAQAAGGETIAGSTFVHVAPSGFDNSIQERGLLLDYSREEPQRLWLTQFNDIDSVDNARQFETSLYRKELWEDQDGTFQSGATVWSVDTSQLNSRPVPAGLSNTTDGVRQWYVTENVPPSALQEIRRVKWR